MQTVLLIEDNADNVELITFILERNGFATVQADTGEAGVLGAREHKPDFILLDIQLPDIDGYEVLRRIRSQADTADIPIIAVTSYAMSGDRERLLAAGCNGYIEKPIDPMKFVEQIVEVVGKQP